MKIGIPNAKLFLFSAFLIAAVPVAEMMTPTEYAPYIKDEFYLSDLIPENIGPWRSAPGFAASQIIGPIGERANRFSIYDQKLTRVYTNDLGDIIMLAIAYGHNQSDAVQLHRPEICYAADGFEILVEERKKFTLPGSIDQKFTTTYLETRRITRFEPVTYWTRIGSEIPADVVSLQISKLITGLMGRVPDGIIIRVSSLSNHPINARILHRDFIDQLLLSVPEKALPVLLGSLAKNWDRQKLKKVTDQSHNFSEKK